MSTITSHFKNGDRAAYELGCLLRNLPTHSQAGAAMSDDERQQTGAAISHAHIATNTLADGLESIGELIFLASGNEDYVLDPRHLANVGNLIKHMAVEMQFLIGQPDDLRSNLDTDAKRAAAAGSAKKGSAK